MDFASAVRTTTKTDRVYFTSARNVFPLTVLNSKSIVYHGPVTNYSRPLTKATLELWSLASWEVEQALFSLYTVQVVHYVPPLFQDSSLTYLQSRLDVLLDRCNLEDEEFKTKTLVAAIVQCAVMETPDESWIDPYVCVDDKTARVVEDMVERVNDKFGVLIEIEEPLAYDYICHAVRICSTTACMWDTFEGNVWSPSMEYRGGLKSAAIGEYTDSGVLYDFSSMYPSILLQCGLDSSKHNILSNCLMQVLHLMLKENPGMKKLIKKMANTTIGYMGTYKCNIGQMRCVQNRSVLAGICTVARHTLRTVMHLGQKLHSLRTVYTDTDSVLFVSNQCDWNTLLEEINREWIPCIFGVNRDQCVITLRRDKTFPNGITVLGKGRLK